MPETPTQFNDGAAYEQMMGRWSRLAGEVFFDWLAPRAGLRWLDVGCGNGAFTELLIERCAPSNVMGIDPSEGQLAYARTRLAAGPVSFRQCDAQTLPFAADEFDVAAMALVINLFPDPAKAVAEIARVVRPGGQVATYVWDVMGGGFTMEPIREALGELGVPTPIYGAEVTRIGKMREVWENAGLDDVMARRIDVQLTYASFDDFWRANTGTPNRISKAIAALSPAEVQQLKARLLVRLPTDQYGRFSYGAHANAVKGTVN